MIQINSISKSYGEVQALDNVSLQVNKNELFGLIGPDGAGKTTLFRILTTLLLPDTGSAQLDGLNAVKDFKAIRNVIGYMPGRFSLYQDLSVEENLNFFATVFDTTIEENYDLIADIYKQIEPFKKRLAGRLSGGMKQKLALSCALIHKPKVLILDEPTTGVDAVSRMEFWQMLKRLQGKDITILVSTPYMDEASLCDRVALIQNGNIMSINTPDGIIEQFPKKLLAITAPNKYKLISDLRTYENAGTVYPFGEYVHFTAKNNDPDSNELKAYLSSKGNQEIEIEPTEANIEDCFMQLMNE
ncbi:MAG: ABC transporter ATP-binding protein [Salinivirgaceae bacterium]|jgi:ABC-2 type transport system ATP-binding protein|nr:ABC transporter ATP-binding protein [Salinivirgaceae bacterium]